MVFLTTMGAGAGVRPLPVLDVLDVLDGLDVLDLPYVTIEPKRCKKDSIMG